MQINEDGLEELYRANIINGIIRDSLMTKDNIGRVRRKLFN